MFRTLFVLLVFAVGLRYSVRGPFYLLLLYLWIAYFRPNEWAWTPVLSAVDASLVVGALLMISTLFSGERFRFGIGTGLLFLFLGQTLLATLASPASAYAWPYWVEFAKTIIIAYLMIVLITDEQRLRMALIVVALSLGLEGAKEGWAEFILHPGAKNVNSWAMLGDNNGVAVGMLMLAATMSALASTTQVKWERYLGRFLAVGVIYRALSTYSRGGFLACGVLVVQYLARTKRKIAGVLGVALVVAVIVSVLPDEFWQRMGTIQSVAENKEVNDDSITSRFHFWDVATAMAADHPLLGVGPNGFNALYDKYDTTRGEFGEDRAVHSIWFGVLAETGFPGLIIFIAVLIHGLSCCRTARRLSRNRPDMANLSAYASAVEGGILVFIVGGTFLPFQYNEMAWHWMAFAIAIGHIARDRAQVMVAAPATHVRTTAMPPTYAALRAR